MQLAVSFFSLYTKIYLKLRRATNGMAWRRPARAAINIEAPRGGQCPTCLAPSRTRQPNSDPRAHDRPPQMTEPAHATPHCRSRPQPSDLDLGALIIARLHVATSYYFDILLDLVSAHIVAYIDLIVSEFRFLFPQMKHMERIEEISRKAQM
ncbi:unnamed protein product [Leptosia nina]|uniref:Uncharacterized protein n=1 Tax=Leptosia nina TaxID=320188 RepID=A0AAV1ITJ5_9NEOP